MELLVFLILTKLFSIVLFKDSQNLSVSLLEIYKALTFRIRNRGSDYLLYRKNLPVISFSMFRRGSHIRLKYGVELDFEAFSDSLL